MPGPPAQKATPARRPEPPAPAWAPSPRAPAEITRLWWWTRGRTVVLVAIAAAVVVYVASSLLPATYQASATVLVTVSATSGISDPTVTAANDLASQDAQLVATAPVIDAADKTLDTALSPSSVSAGTVNAENLIKINATGPTAAQANASVNAVARAFVAYVSQISTSQAADYVKLVTANLAPLANLITTARQQQTSGTPVQQAQATALLTTLVGVRQQVLGAAVQSSAATLPDVLLVSPGDGGSKTSPRPQLYALIAFGVVLLLLGRLLFVVGVRRTRESASR